MPSADPIGAGIMARIDTLAAISESPEGLARHYLTPEHRRANDLVAGWMRDAGMTVGEDAVGNVVGRYEGMAPGAPALIVGSHLDTVPHGGPYDGALGVIAALEVLRVVKENTIAIFLCILLISYNQVPE